MREGSVSFTPFFNRQLRRGGGGGGGSSSLAVQQSMSSALRCTEPKPSHYSLDKPLRLQDVEAARNSKNSAREG